jgi:hypothetical protein
MYLTCWNTLPSLKNEGPLKIIRYEAMAKTACLRNHVHTMFSFLGKVAWEKDASIVMLCTKQTSCSSCTCVVDRDARWEQPLSSSTLLGCLKELEPFKGTQVYNRKVKNMSFLSYTSVLLKSSSQDSQYPDFLLCTLFPVVVWLDEIPCFEEHSNNLTNTTLIPPPRKKTNP